MSYKLAITSHSLGRAWIHEIQAKLDAAAGYAGVEAFYEDLEYLAKTFPGGMNDSNLLNAAAEFRTMCDNRGLTVIGLQPFLHYEGLLDRSEHEKRLTKLKLWFQVVKILGTDLIQVPSNFLVEGITNDRETIVADLRTIAELGLQETPVVRFAYEGLCWGTYINSWSGSWSIVASVDRPNFGICLDTFHIAGLEWADPSVPSGRIANADEHLKTSLEKLVKEVDVKKVFYVQLVDGERLDAPLDSNHAFWVNGQPARMSWSRNARLFALEDGGYMPVMDVLKAFVDPQPAGLGYTGWISQELFSRTMAESGKGVPIEHARRGLNSWKKVCDVMHFK